MFNANDFIDNLQTSTKTFLDSFVTDPTVKSTMNAFVDAQTIFAKQLVKTSESFTEHFKKF
jgi:hypothetical protein